MANAPVAAPHIQSEIPHARMAGRGTSKWFGMKVYEATLWVGESGYQSASPGAEKFALNLEYARELYGVRIAEASLKEMENIGIGSAQQRQIWLAQMKGIFPDVTVGAHITGVYLPDQGARFYLNGSKLGAVMDPEFGRAFFAIWLDPRTSDKKLRIALIGAN
jgi:hypothetical protein